jgi:signal transduction histidine kinase
MPTDCLPVPQHRWTLDQLLDWLTDVQPRHGRAQCAHARRGLRWLIPLLVLALAALYQTVLHLAVAPLAEPWEAVTGFVVYGLTGSVVAWIGLRWIADGVTRRAAAEAQMRAAYAELEISHQRLLALHDLGQQIASADSEQAVLELAAQAPLQLASARASTVVTFDDSGNRLKLDMAWGLSENYLRALRARLDAGIDAARCRDCVVLKTHASSDCPLFVGMHVAAQAEGIGSLACLPIVRDRDRVGVIAAYFPSVNGPPEDQLRLLNIAGGAIAAMLENLRTRTRQVSALHALHAAAQTNDALSDFAAQVLDIALAGWEAQAGGLFLFDAATHTWTCRAGRGLGDALTDPRFDLALQTVRQAHAAGQTVVISELDAGAGHDLRSVAAAPFITEGQTLGALFLGARRPRTLAERHADLLATLAHQIALAIRNAQLYAQLGQTAVYEERYRLAREIHDGLAQTLAYLGLQTERMEKLLGSGRHEEAARELAEMRQSIRAAYVDAREAIDGLRLSVENPDQLAAGLAEYVADFARQTGLEASFAAEPADLTTDPHTALQLLRIAQEALTNVRKHAQARRVQVSLSAAPAELELKVTDDGRGFPDGLQPDRVFRRHGLATMRERARSIGGTFTVATGNGQGTRIAVTIPLRGKP